MSEKLVLIDGNSIVNRAFFGIPELTNAEGLHTNAIYGFLNILFKILSEEDPQYLAVAFDLHAPTFRHKMYSAYKGTRKPMPTELKEQIEPLKELLRAMEVKIVEMEGYEADDILGTLARRGEALGMDVTLVSGDRDLLQIATDRIKIRIPKTKGGKTETEDYYTQDVISKYGITPAQVIELKALMGDSSDNIPGVPKIGEKTATALVQEYGNIETLKDNIDAITKPSIKATLSENFDMAVLSKELATIETNVPINVSSDEMRISELYTKESYRLVKKLGFKNMLSRFEHNEASVNDVEDRFKIVDGLSEADRLFTEIKNAGSVAFYILAEGNTVYGVSFCTGDENICFIPVGGFLTEAYLINNLVDIISNNQNYVTYKLKEQLFYLKDSVSMDMAGASFADIKIAAYLLNPLTNDYDIEDIAGEQLNMTIKGYKERFPKTSLADALEQNIINVRDYACYIAYVCYKTGSILKEKLEAQGMYRLFTDIEMPLCVCLFRMQREGILVKRDELKAFSARLGDRIASLEKEIYSLAGEEFNINSPKQLGEILFEKMKLPGGKKTKTGYSTAADVLEKLAQEVPFVRLILEYRTLAKLKSTYADGLVAYIDSDDRIHSTFHQTITATGRISSADPNLQNIPIRMEEGRLIRKVFVPMEGCVFVDADYSQIELRLMAHMSGDEKLIEAYRRSDDIHAITASEVFKVPLKDVTPELRRNAKAVNFGIIYGISSFGLSQDLSISRADAKNYIESYFNNFPGVKSFIDNLVDGAKKNGYAITMFGRRRPIPELNSNNFMQRSFGERVAMNAPIQGSAADIMKIAMINVMKKMDELGLKSKLLLQVHDELLIEAYKDELETVRTILSEEMMHAADLLVQLEVDMHDGNTWYDAK